MKIEWARTHPKEMRDMGQAARVEYEAKYTAEHNYRQLMTIYSRAIAEREKPDKLTDIGRTARAEHEAK